MRKEKSNRPPSLHYVYKYAGTARDVVAASGLEQYGEPQKEALQYHKAEFDGAPHGTAVEILKRVPAKSVCRSGRVCKMLLSIVDSPSFVTLHSNFVFDPDSHLLPAPPQFILHYHLSRYWCSTSNRNNFHTT